MQGLDSTRAFEHKNKPKNVHTVTRNWLVNAAIRPQKARVPRRVLFTESIKVSGSNWKQTSRDSETRGK